MTKIDIISGFLGAGKTTLIKKLIGEAYKGEKIALIENEFGEIGIDSGFLGQSGVEITEMNAGCICCSLVGDFEEALHEVIAKYSPDRIIIEPTGVGKLSDVVNAVLKVNKNEESVSINSKTAVVDVLKCKMYIKNFGEFFNNQIETADCIILSRTQKASDAKIEEAIKLIKEHNKDAKIVTTPWDDVDGKVLLSAMEDSRNLANDLLAQAEEHEHHHHHDGECCGGHHHDEEGHHHHDGECCGGHHHHDEEHEHHHHDGECCGGHHHHDEEGHEHHHDHDGKCSCGHDHGDGHHHHHHADDVFTSWGIETPKKFNQDNVQVALQKLANTDEFGIILRAKGILQDEEGKWFTFDLVPGEFEIREENADYTSRLCVIGTKLDEAKLAELFNL